MNRFWGALCVLALALLVTSCGTRYYSATVSGYVKDVSFGTGGNANGNGGNTGNGGINDAEIRIYLTDPAKDPDGYVVKSSTASSGGNNGFWSHKITWETANPAFSDTGDSGAIWVSVKRMGYFPKTVKVTGILSDATNLVPTIELTLIKTTEVRGKVVNEKGNPVNGVNVVLDLGSTTANDADFTTTSATVDGEDGIFVFNDVPWNDPDSIPTVSKSLSADGLTATEQIKVYVNDANYFCDLANHDILDTLSTSLVTSDKKLDLTAAPLVVRTVSFSIPELRGRVLDAANTANGLNGVQVSVRIPASNANADPSVTTATVGTDGWFVFNNLSWTNLHPHRSAPGVYDDQTSAMIYVSGANFYSDNDASNPVMVTLVSDTSKNMGSTTLIAGKATFKKGSIKGRIVAPGTTTGLNGITVSLNLADSNANPAYTVTTGSIGSGAANDGFFEFKNLTWTNTKPIWKSGSSQTIAMENVQIFVNDANFASPNGANSPFVVTIDSDTVAGVSTPTDLTSTPISAKRITFNVPSITGVVQNSAGTVLGNISVSLALKSGTANNNNQGAVTTDSNGKFTFTNVGWTNNSPSSPSTSADTISVALSVNDANYSTSTPLSEFTIDSGSAKDLTSTPIKVDRTTTWNFTTTVQGRTQHRNNETTGSLYDPVAGQQVVLSAVGADASVSVSGNLQLSTDGNGNWTTNVSWSRPPNYDWAANSKQNGRDTLLVSIAFPDIESRSDNIVFSTVTTYQVNSWLNTNTAPTATDPVSSHY